VVARAVPIRFSAPSRIDEVPVLPECEIGTLRLTKVNVHL
jgi:hypothetical protein